VKGVRFSPYAWIDRKADIVLSAAGAAQAMTDPARRVWGRYDGSGDPIRLTFAGYFKKFIYDRDFAAAPQISYNVSQATGNTRSNLWEEYPNAAFVEYYFPESGTTHWASLRLVFQENQGKYRLVEIVHDEWTI